MATWDKAERRWDFRRDRDPIGYCFVDRSSGGDHPARNWTEQEKAAARHAIDEWNQALKEASRRQGASDRDRVVEAQGEGCDVTLRWEDDRFFRDWTGADSGVDLSAAAGWTDLPGGESLEKSPERDQSPWTPGRDTTAFPVGEIYLNVAPAAVSIEDFRGWFVDETPDDDSEFEPRENDNGAEILRARREGPADKRIDFYTIVKHEFGHMLGLLHDGAYDDQSDRGEIMRRGVGGEERRHELPIAGPLVGERRHLMKRDLERLESLYGNAFKSEGRLPRLWMALIVLLLAIAILLFRLLR